MSQSKHLQAIRLSSEAGFGLLEVIITAGIMGTIALGVVSFQSHSFKMLRTSAVGMETQEYSRMMSILLSDSNLCTGALQPYNFGGWTPANTSDISLTDLNVNGAPFIQLFDRNGFALQSMRVSTDSATFPRAAISSGFGYYGSEQRYNTATSSWETLERYLGYIEMRFTESGESYGRNEFLKGFPVTIGKIAGSNTISFCYGYDGDDRGTADDEQAFCEEVMGGRYDETRRPRCLLGSLGITGSFDNRDNAISYIQASGIPVQDGTFYVSNKLRVGQYSTNPTFAGNAVAQIGTYTTFTDDESQPTVQIRGLGSTSRTGPLLQLGNHAFFNAANPNLAPLVYLTSDASSTQPLLQIDDNIFMNNNPATGNRAVMELRGQGTNYSSPLLQFGQHGWVYKYQANSPVFALGPARQFIVYPEGRVTTTANIEVGGQVQVASDRRLKKDLAPIENPLEKILSLEGFLYQKKIGDEYRKEMGVIAQEIEKVFPEAVSSNEKGYKMVAYEMLIAPLIEAIKEQQKQISENINMCQGQEDRVQALESRMAQAEKRLLEQDQLIRSLLKRVETLERKPASELKK